jgi:hypothetical protein
VLAIGIERKNGTRKKKKSGQEKREKRGRIYLLLRSNSFEACSKNKPILFVGLPAN